MGSSTMINFIGDNPDSHHIMGEDKTLFKGSYRRPTNFGMRKHLLETQTINNFQEINRGKFNFTIDNTYDLLLNTHLVIELPNIWSPIHSDTIDDVWRPFEFRWANKLGTSIIHKVTITIGDIVVQEFNGHYIQNLADREFTDEKHQLFDQMIGDTPELNDPANFHGNGGYYPNASHKDSKNSDDSLEYDVEPSIRGRNLIIPILGWYSFSSKQAVPLCCMKKYKREMVISVEFRPLCEWYTVKSVHPGVKGHHNDHSKRSHVSPRYATTNEDDVTGNGSIDTVYSLRRFMREPPNDGKWAQIHGSADKTYPDYVSHPEAIKSYYENIKYTSIKVYMVTTNAMLTEVERDEFLYSPKEYLYKQVRIIENENVKLTSRYTLENTGIMANMTIYMQRSDVAKRNEFCNFTNLKYEGKRNTELTNPKDDAYLYSFGEDEGAASGDWDVDLRKSRKDEATNDNKFRTTGRYSLHNRENILRRYNLYFSTIEKEQDLEANVISSIERFTNCAGGRNLPHLHFYSFEIDSNPYDVSPSGHINTLNFNKIEIDYSLYPPPLNPQYEFITICDEENNFIQTKKISEEMHIYNYNMFICIEKYQKLRFDRGEVSILWHT